MSNENSWIKVEFHNTTNGEKITLYHVPTRTSGAGKSVDEQLRYAVLGLPKPKDSHIKISALPCGADWLNKLVPPSDIPA